MFRAGRPGTNSHTVAATRLVWAAVILNSSETSGPLLNGRILKMYSLEVYIKSFGGQKGGSLEPPRTPPAYGPRGGGGVIFRYPVVHKRLPYP